MTTTRTEQRLKILEDRMLVVEALASPPLAKILDDLGEKLAARQIQFAQSNTQHKGVFVSVLQIFLKALGEVRTRNFGERGK